MSASATPQELDSSASDSVRACLEISTHDGVIRTELHKGIYLVGRSKQCQIRPKSSSVSRKHCAIVCHDQKIFVRDIGSKHGTFINRKRISDGVLQPVSSDDELIIGGCIFHFRFAESLAEATAKVIEDDNTSLQDPSASSIDKLDLSDDDIDPSLLDSDDGQSDDDQLLRTINQGEEEDLGSPNETLRVLHQPAQAEEDQSNDEDKLGSANGEVVQLASETYDKTPNSAVDFDDDEEFFGEHEQASNADPIESAPAALSAEEAGVDEVGDPLPIDGEEAVLQFLVDEDEQEEQEVAQTHALGEESSTDTTESGSASEKTAINGDKPLVTRKTDDEPEKDGLQDWDVKSVQKWVADKAPTKKEEPKARKFKFKDKKKAKEQLEEEARREARTRELLGQPEREPSRFERWLESDTIKPLAIGFAIVTFAGWIAYNIYLLAAFDG